VWTLPFPVAGILRFLDLAVWRPRAESPTDAILRDWMTLVIGAAWTGAVLFIIYDA
jgi:hypothetical protein